jgi:hypothetical protein
MSGGDGLDMTNRNLDCLVPTPICVAGQPPQLTDNAQDTVHAAHLKWRIVDTPFATAEVYNSHIRSLKGVIRLLQKPIKGFRKASNLCGSPRIG